MQNENRGEDISDKPLTYDEVRIMVRDLMRYPNLLRDALRVGLAPEHFYSADHNEMPFYYLFAALRGLFNKHGAVTRDMLVTELNAWRSSSAISLNDAEFVDLVGDSGFIDQAYSDAAEPTTRTTSPRAEREYTESILRRFIKTRFIQQELQKTLNRGGDASVTNLDVQLERWTKTAQSVEYLGRVVDNAAAAPAFGQQIKLPPPAVPTTLPWIDNYIGGFRRGDIIGVLGPYQGGKSTLLATAMIRLAQQYYIHNENKLAVFIGYEDGAEKFNHMFWSAAAHIDRRLFVDDPNFWENMSTSANLKPYEMNLPENKNGEIIFGERERWESMLVWYNRHFCFLDFSANTESGNHGTGGVPEISAVLQQLSELRNMDIGAVAIDYAGLMLDRELSQDNRTKNMEQVWRPMKVLPDTIRTTVAVPFGCTVMLAHQLAGGDIKNKPPYRYVTHLDAQGSKAFAENLHSCICINTRDEDTRVSTIYWSKIRASVPVTPYGLIRMDDNVVDIHLVNDEYTASESARKILKRGEIAPVSVADARALQAARSGSASDIDTFGDDILS